MVLLVGAALMIQSVARLQQRDLGFDPAPLIVAELAASPATAATRDLMNTTNDLVSRLESLPGVVAAAGANSLPFAGPNPGNVFSIEGQVRPSGPLPDTDLRVVTGGYFATVGLPLLRGRLFTEADRQTAPAVIISASAARRYWSDRDPVGTRIQLGNSDWATIVGIVGDARYHGLEEPGDDLRPMMYLPHRQMPEAAMTFVVKAASPDTLVASVRTALRAAAPDRAVIRLELMSAILARARGPQLFTMTLLTVFASMAAILSAVGLYGLIAYLVSRRTKEIGVRLALGASRRDIVRITAGHGVVLTAIGTGIGVLGAWGMAGALRKVLFGVSSTDPLTYVAVATAFVVLAATASYVPARRALRINPIDSLRTD